MHSYCYAMLWDKPIANKVSMASKGHSYSNGRLWPLKAIASSIRYPIPDILTHALGLIPLRDNNDHITINIKNNHDIILISYTNYYNIINQYNLILFNTLSLNIEQ